MCGIAGIVAADKSFVRDDQLKAMAGSVAHRGPDDDARWISASGLAGFAHRRLCVIDLGKESGQPMHWESRYSIVYNGEIYNYRELRSSLAEKGYQFRTKSDTEVILAAYSAHGKDCLKYFDGMFAFAIWDNQNQELFCARDRFGEKPFYYLIVAGKSTLMFASEIKAFRAAGIESRVNNSLLLSFIGTGYTANPVDPSETFDERIKILPASHFMTFQPTLNQLTMVKYWELSTETVSMKFSNAVEEFNSLLKTSVIRRLRSDVQLGMSLSGGIDSSSLARTIADFHTTGIKTFTAAFPGFEKDETGKAKWVASLCGFENYTTTPNVDDLIADIDKLLYFQEEPFSSSSVYAQYKVFELAAANQVTVLLDGQGADEVLAGYDKYRKWKQKTIFPALTASLLRNKEFQTLNHDQFINDDFKRNFINGITFFKPVIRDLNDLLYYNLFGMGLQELLKLADRNSMAHGREVRLPFLYHELVQFVFRLPADFKIGHGYTKLILRETFKDRFPSEITHDHVKIGYEPPQLQWMQSSRMREFARNSKRSLVEAGILNKSIFEHPYRAHAAYERDSREWRWMVAGRWLELNKKGV